MRTERLVDRLVWMPFTGAPPARGLLQLRTETVLPASVEDTFSFFSNAANLETLTPPWLNFRIRTPSPIVMREGLEIEYQIVLHGLPIPWRSRIDIWEPGRRFVDRQVLGPYRWWRHEHIFEPIASGTSVIDRIEFVPRLRWLSSRVVRRDVERIFAYRREQLERVFSRSTASPL